MGRHDQSHAGRRFAVALKAIWPGRATIKDPRAPEQTPWNAFPSSKIGRSLLVTIQVDMHDRLAMALQEDLTRRSWKPAREVC